MLISSALLLTLSQKLDPTEGYISHNTSRNPTPTPITIVIGKKSTDNRHRMPYVFETSSKENPNSPAIIEKSIMNIRISKSLTRYSNRINGTYVRNNKIFRGIFKIELSLILLLSSYSNSIYFCPYEIIT